MMKDITFKIKVITPTLMGGGFGQNDGIRPSEIKGLMRYWFRAVAGSVIGNDIKTLKNLEEKVFGSQERKSPFRIVIEDFDKNNSLEKIEFNNLPNGVKYLGFVINMNKERLENVVKAGSEFKVKFLFKNSIDKKIIKLVAYSFYIATALGGFGLRARRGFGSWQIVNVNNNGINENFENLKDYKKNVIDKNINTVKKLTQDLCKNLNIKVCNSFQTGIKLNYTNFINYKLEQIHTNKSDWKEILNDLGAYYRYFRVNPETNDLQKDDFKRKHSLDYDEILNRGKKLKELYNPIFGLSIIYKKGISVDLKGNNGTFRRASPLFISVKIINRRLTLNLFISLSTNFKDKEQNMKLRFYQKEFPVIVKNFNNYKTITDFVEKLKNAMGSKNGN